MIGSTFIHSEKQLFDGLKDAVRFDTSGRSFNLTTGMKFFLFWRLIPADGSGFSAQRSMPDDVHSAISVSVGHSF
jgi:hypothetical protein